MKYIILYIWCFLFLGAVSSCESLLLEAEPENTPETVFNYLWTEAKEKYAFFEYKNIDWDEVYDRYQPQIKAEMSQAELFNVLFAMLNELRDGHVNLISPFNVSRYNVDLLGPQNFDWRILRENYLGEDYYITGPLNHDFLANEKVGYVRYASFSSFVSQLDLDFVMLRYRETDGMIIDLRQNGGGSIANVFQILNRFVDEKTLVYNSYLKTGPGPNDFSEAQAAYLEPEEDHLDYDKPVVLLVDRGTYSASSFFALAAKALPQFTIIGDNTGGGLGIPNGGQLPNGWTYRFSISQTLSLDGQNYEDGVPPDEKVIMSAVNRLQGKDPVLERAIELITG